MHPAVEHSVAIGAITLQGVSRHPAGARGLVLFAHGSGSGRLSPRNNYVAERLSRAGIATLLFDLLTGEEEEIDAVTAELRFDIPLLTDRLLATTAWALRQPQFQALAIGYFGASTGAAAALAAAARVPQVAAVVSRGGRPDLAGSALPQVRAPTLLIVGGRDPEVLALNRAAYERLSCERRLEIVPGASHLFAEPGALEQVASLASGWFERHLTAATPVPARR
jgi:putative phosphoribosyl transferase